VRQTPIRGLWLLPAGEWNQKTAEALAEKGVGAVLEPLKQQFDFIVIDSSPVLAVVDALLIGQSADAVLLSILREVSRMPAIQAAYQRLHALGIRMLGCVVNGTAANDQVYGGAYGYGYGYGRHSAQQNSGEQ
jgi:Mrp family chromosome partitioning ATPase